MKNKKNKDKILRSKTNPDNYIHLCRESLYLTEDGKTKRYYYIYVEGKIKLLYEIVD